MLRKRIKSDAINKLEDVVPVPDAYKKSVYNINNKKTFSLKIKIALTTFLMVILSSTIVILTLNAKLISGKQIKSENTNSSLNSGDMFYRIPKWEDKNVPERYPEVTFGDIYYKALGFQPILDVAIVDDQISNSSLYGYDEIEKMSHTASASIFSIKAFDVESCIALKVDDDKHDERYFVYVNTEISYSNLNEYMEKLGFPETVDINSGLITRKIFFPEQENGPIVEFYDDFDKNQLFNLIFSNNSLEKLDAPKPYDNSEYEEIIVNEAIEQFDSNGNIVKTETLQIEYNFRGFENGPNNLNIGIRINEKNQMLLYIFGDRLQLKLKNDVYSFVRNVIL